MDWTTLVAVVVGFIMSEAKDRFTRRSDSARKRSDVRRLLAHHANTLADDADHFDEKARPFSGAPEQQIANSFVDVSTSSRVFRNEIATRVSELTDELIDLFNDLDVADSEAAAAVNTLRGLSSRFFQPAQAYPGGYPGMGQLPAPNLPRPLSDELHAATEAFSRLREAAHATLLRLNEENDAMESIGEVTPLPARAMARLTGLTAGSRQLPSAKKTP